MKRAALAGGMTVGSSQNTGRAVRHRAFKSGAEAWPLQDGPERRAADPRMAGSYAAVALSASTNARVPKPTMFLQSGHGQAKLARRYMAPDDPQLLYMTGRAVLGMVG